MLKAKQLAANIVDSCTVTFDANDMKIEEPDDIIGSESEDKSVSERQESYLKRNYLDISSAVVTTARFGVLSNTADAVINGLLDDLPKAWQLGKDKKDLL